MFTVEEYITQMKKKDKLDEFNFRKHAENMASVISYVMEYFNNYLNPEEYNYEQIKIDQTILKIKQEIEKSLPKSLGFVTEYYKDKVTRIDRSLKKFLEGFEYSDLLYCKEDYENLVDAFCSNYKMKNTGVEIYKAELVILAEELKYLNTEKPLISDCKFLDNCLVGWIKETYRKYNVNLLAFAYTIADEYYEKFIEYVHDRISNTSYHVNHYNHRYNEDPFEITDIYNDNKHRPFIDGRKGELEMLIMHDWVFDWAHDSDYWAEYVNLCVSTGRVSLVKNRNILIPVSIQDFQYPSDITSNLVFYETSNGNLKVAPDKPYILRLNHSNDNDSVWKDKSMLKTLIANLDDTFVKFGAPNVLELLSPFRNNNYNEEAFFDHYQLMEKSMRKYTNMNISLVNGVTNSKSKPNYLLQTADDIVKMRNLAKQMKFKVKFTIDILSLLGRKDVNNEGENIFLRLTEIRNSVIGIHLNKSFNRSYIRRIIEEDDSRFISEYNYPHVSDLLGCLTAFLGDNQSRYLVPKKVNSQDELEELIDDLLRAGFSFQSPEVI